MVSPSRERARVFLWEYCVIPKILPISALINTTSRLANCPIFILCVLASHVFPGGCFNTLLLVPLWQTNTTAGPANLLPALLGLFTGKSIYLLIYRFIYLFFGEYERSRKLYSFIHLRIHHHSCSYQFYIYFFEGFRCE